jgi:hypothetical protein
MLSYEIDGSILILRASGPRRLNSVNRYSTQCGPMRASRMVRW